MKKILVIDNEAHVLKLYSTLLGKAGYVVLTASSAKQGFDLAVSAQPSLILLDVMMPSVDGTEALAQLSENAGTAHIPVIFLTSLLKESEVEESRGEIGGHEFISKSTPFDKVLSRVKTALSRSSNLPPVDLQG